MYLDETDFLCRSLSYIYFIYFKNIYLGRLLAHAKEFKSRHMKIYTSEYSKTLFSVDFIKRNFIRDKQDLFLCVYKSKNKTFLVSISYLSRKQGIFKQIFLLFFEIHFKYYSKLHYIIYGIYSSHKKLKNILNKEFS